MSRANVSLVRSASKLGLTGGNTCGRCWHRSSCSASSSARSSIASAATPGVSKDDIKLGVTYVDLEAIRDVTDINHGDYEGSYNAVIDELNKKGGVNGRKLVPVFAKVNPLGTAPAQEACLKLTEDEQVFAAVGFFYFDAPACYVTQHDTPILGGTMSPDLLKQAKAPWMTLESGPEVSPRVIDALAEGGALKGKLGIVALATEEKNLLDAQVLPGLKRNGIKGTVAIIDAPLTDVVAGTQQATTIAERFKADGIKTVLLVGGTPSAFTNGLKNTDYRPEAGGDELQHVPGRRRSTRPRTLRSTRTPSRPTSASTSTTRACRSATRPSRRSPATPSWSSRKPGSPTTRHRRPTRAATCRCSPSSPPPQARTSPLRASARRRRSWGR